MRVANSRYNTAAEFGNSAEQGGMEQANKIRAHPPTERKIVAITDAESVSAQ